MEDLKQNDSALGEEKNNEHGRSRSSRSRSSRSHLLREVFVGFKDLKKVNKPHKSIFHNAIEDRTFREDPFISEEKEEVKEIEVPNTIESHKVALEEPFQILESNNTTIEDRKQERKVDFSEYFLDIEASDSTNLMLEKLKDQMSQCLITSCPSQIFINYERNPKSLQLCEAHLLDFKLCSQELGPEFVDLFSGCIFSTQDIDEITQLIRDMNETLNGHGLKSDYKLNKMKKTELKAMGKEYTRKYLAMDEISDTLMNYLMEVEGHSRSSALNKISTQKYKFEEKLEQLSQALSHNVDEILEEEIKFEELEGSKNQEALQFLRSYLIPNIKDLSPSETKEIRAGEDYVSQRILENDILWIIKYPEDYLCQV